MRGRTTGLRVEVGAATREQLEQLVRRQKTPAGLAKRARAVLLVADGQRLRQTARQVGLTERNLRKWPERFIARGLPGLRDLPRSGRPPVFPPRGSAARGQDGQRAPGRAGPLAGPVGLRRVGAPVGGRGGGGADLG